eukprot:GILK01021659.1.p1 GENE.GILK01021659.1~~GILK01021659.1.p1  ORF type:complete len:477 (-),score=43.82 GILK01021659.1:212-1477(-)
MQQQYQQAQQQLYQPIMSQPNQNMGGPGMYNNNNAPMIRNGMNQQPMSNGYMNPGQNIYGSPNYNGNSAMNMTNPLSATYGSGNSGSIPNHMIDASRWRLSDLDLKETLGTGTFGRVRLCKHKTLQRFFALKMIKKQEILRLKQVDHILSEAAILKDPKHPFIVNMFKGFADEDRLYLLMEVVVGGELFSHLRKAGKFPNDVAKFYCCEVLLAFEYLHDQNIIYRDLKPENILLDEGGHVKIADFGFAKRVTERTFTLCGTPEYIAPEVIQSRGHGKAVDYWALGILLYEMIVGYPPFFDESPFKTYEKILEGKLQFPKWVDSRARDIIRGLLTADHTKRLGTLKRGMQDLKKHKYFAGVDWDVMLSKKIPAPIPVRIAKDGDSRYFDRYPESPPNRQLKALSQQQQDLFKGFCNGEYGLP